MRRPMMLATISALLLLGVVGLGASRAGSRHLSRVFAAGLRDARLSPPPPGPVVDEAAIAALPVPVRHYLRFMGVVGRPRDGSMRARFNGRFRLADGKWVRCEVLQYDARLELSRLFYMQLSLGHVLPVTVRDTYVSGRGLMLAKAFDWFGVAEGAGYELDAGELVTYLNDAILMAPSLLLGPETSWREVEPLAFDVTLTDGSLSVTARVWLDERGAPRDFSTTDRFFDLPDGKRVRTEWRTPVSGWQQVGHRQLPTRAQAVWQLTAAHQGAHLGPGPFPYADFQVDPTQIAFNVPAE